ncbi:MAG: RelA/SpoT domain-containing protein, partial [Verrucomicrobiales bacterium]|nr:RelA/SpoT domain-containing protein [Verrucomicrobiales bacterium]
MREPPTSAELGTMVSLYRQQQETYRDFAAALKSVLEAACRDELPDAIVQARAKSLTSFIGKCIRKPDRYADPARDMTDLCGARVIVQTVTQVLSVRRFVEDNFEVVETEDIGLRLGEREFGYRDRHYIVRLNPARAREIGFTARQIRSIGSRVAELQVRTWAQHAWADTLHDRTYKPVLAPGKEAERRAALLAALMETSDQIFDGVANEIDGLAANYLPEKHHSQLLRELGVQSSLREHALEQDRTGIAVETARIHLALGQCTDAITLLEGCDGGSGPFSEHWQLELGTALCLCHRLQPQSPEY